MVDWSLRVGLISCLSSPKEILVTLLPAAAAAFLGKLPDKIFIAHHIASSFSGANMLKRTTNMVCEMASLICSNSATFCIAN